jgi:hypothetical protein
MSDRTSHLVTVTGHDGREHTFHFSAETLQRMWRDSLWTSVVTSSDMEGVNLSDLPPPHPDTIPVNLLTTP